MILNMKIRSEDKLEEVLDVSDNQIPEIAEFERKPKQPKVSCLEEEIRKQLNRLKLMKEIAPGAKVAITAGSRGINNIDKILQFCVKYLKSQGAVPFIFPAMGSHGGATPQGQIKMLISLGVTESNMGCPIKATMKTKKLGVTKAGFPVLVDSIACEADRILIVNRVKPHTAFNAEIESGLLKMMVIGMGKQQGARMTHKQGFAYGLSKVILDVGRIILNKLPILGGLAVVENFYDETAIIKGVNPEKFFEEEKNLLTKAKHMMATLPANKVDILIINEMGKNISGTGMDTNIIGRFLTLGESEPEKPSVSRIYVRDLTEVSHGNALGVGLADFTHQRLVDKIKLQDTYINSLTGTGPEKSRTPPFFQRDKTALKACLASIGKLPDDAKILWIKNTMELSNFFASKLNHW